MNTKQKKNPTVNETVLDNQADNVSNVDVNAAENQDNDIGVALEEAEPKAPSAPNSALETTDPTARFTLLIDNGKALKLSPKTQNHVFFQLGLKDEDNTLHIRMSGNEGGGLHSKEWVSVDDIITILDTQKGKALKSTLLKPVFTGGSANNCGFMAAVLRSSDIGFLMQSEKSVFVHRLTDDYDGRKQALFSLCQ